MQWTSLGKGIKKAIHSLTEKLSEEEPDEINFVNYLSYEESHWEI